MRQFSKVSLLALMFCALGVFQGRMHAAEEQRQVRVHQEELEELTKSEKSYVFVGAEASDILLTLQRVANLAQPEDALPAFRELNDRLSKGYKTAAKETILEVFNESEFLIETRHGKCASADQVKEMIEGVEAWRKVVAADDLTIGWADVPCDAARRAPRPGESTGVETEGIPSDEGTDVCCPLPRDVFIERNLTVGGDLTVEGALILVGPLVITNDIILQPLFPQNAICLIWFENVVNGGAEKARLCDSSIVGDKGLYISVDGGVTENFRVTNSGDVSLANNLLLENSTASVGTIQQAGTVTFHNFGGDTLSSVYLGKNAGNLTNTGVSNTAVGYLALNSVTTGSNNVALGRSAMQNATTGNRNVVVGDEAGIGIISGLHNTIVGDSAGFLLSTGSSNVYIGRGAAALSALANNNSIVIQSQPTNAGTGSTANNQIRIGFGDTASDNTFIDGINGTNIGAAANIVGINATAQLGTTATTFTLTGSESVTGSITAGTGITITTGDLVITSGSIYLPATSSATVGNIFKAGARFMHDAGGATNVFLGTNAGNFVTVAGTNDIGIGNSALLALTTGSNNVALGSSAGTAVTTGADNTLVGTSAGAGLTTGSSNVAVGRRALATASTGSSNVAIGVLAGEDLTTAADNTLVGTQSGANLTTGGSNVALGRSALLTATTAAGNVALGVQAGEDITTAADNTLVGTQAGANLTTGASNVAVGRSTLLAATTGQGHAILGYHAGMAITTANDNTLVGTEAGVALTTGGNNTAIGRRALFTSTTGTMNVAVGDQSGNNMTTGINNTLLGSGAGFSLTTGSNNIHVGINASSGINFDNGIVLQSRPASGGTQLTASNQIRIGFGDTASSTTFVDGINTANIGATANVVGVNASGQLGTTATTFTLTGSESVTGSVTAGTGVTITTGDLVVTAGSIYLPATSSATVGNVFKAGARYLHNAGAASNVFLGTDAGNFVTVAGTDDIGIGNSALLALTTGSFNVAVGTNALLTATTASSNVAVGMQAGEDITTATDNTLVGTQAGADLTTGSSNVAVGRSALRFGTTSGANVAVGGSALFGISTGNGNVAVGSGAGISIDTGSFNTYVGNGAGSANTLADTNNIYIGDSVFGVAGESNAIRIGSGSTDCYIAGIFGNPTLGVGVYIDASGHLSTTPSSIRYKENIAELSSITSRFMQLNPVGFSYKADATHHKQYGLIAEEVEAIYPELIVYKDGQVEGLAYHLLDAFYIKMIQDQQRLIEDLQRRVAALEVA